MLLEEQGRSWRWAETRAAPCLLEVPATNPRLRQHRQQKPQHGTRLTSVSCLQREGADGREIKANDITCWHGSTHQELFLAGPGPGFLLKCLQMWLRAPGAGLQLLLWAPRPSRVLPTPGCAWGQQWSQHCPMAATALHGCTGTYRAASQ